MKPESTKAEARKLRAEGRSFSEIGELLGVSGACVFLWCDDNASERNKSAANERHKDKSKRVRDKAQRKLARSTLHGRCMRALQASRYQAKRNGWVGCNATIEQVKAAFSGSCSLCGCESGSGHRGLHLDHDHNTGAFRGWLCHQCNILLGMAGDDPERLLRAANYIENHAIAEWVA